MGYPKDGHLVDDFLNKFFNTSDQWYIGSLKVHIHPI